MPTLEIDERFEVDLAAYTATGSPALSTAANLDTANGAKGLLCTGAGAQNLRATLAAGRAVEVGRFLFRMPAGGLPVTAAAGLIQCISTIGTITMQIKVTTGGVLQAQCTGGTAQSGPTLVADQTYLIDYKMDCSGTTYTIDWKVDGVAKTQATLAGQSATTFTTTGRKLGNVAAGVTAQAFHFDAWATSATAGDYSIGVPALLARLKRKAIAIRLALGL